MHGPLGESLAHLELGWVEATVGSERGLALPALEEPALRETGGADSRTVGAEIMRRYSYPAAVAAIVFGRERRVPRLGAAAILPGRVVLGGAFYCEPDDPGAEHPDARVVADLRARLAAEVVAYLEPAVQPLYERTRLGQRAL